MSGKLNLKKIFGMKVFSILLAGVIGLFAFNLFKEYSKNMQLNAEIKKLEASAKEIESKNLEILNLTKYLNTEEFLESEARTKMGLQKQGEETFVVNISGITRVASSTAEKKTVFSNPTAWWLYFFGK